MTTKFLPVLFLLAACLAAGMAGNAQAGSVQFSTYYPAPFGMYDRLRLVPRAALIAPCDPGTFYYETGTGLKLCDETATWGILGGGAGGFWSKTGSNLYPTTITDNVGIGTTAPDSPLHIEQNTVDRVKFALKNTHPTNKSAGIILGGPPNVSEGWIISNDFSQNGGNDFFIFDRTPVTGGVRMFFNSNGNVGIGTQAPNNRIQVLDLINFNNTAFNTFLGYQTGAVAPLGATKSTLIGYQAGSSDTSGGANTAVGYQALMNSTGGANTAIGAEALRNNTGLQFNTAVGYQALLSNAGSSNTATGTGALLMNGTGSNNTANGAGALTGNTTGSNNTAIGYAAGYSLSNGSNNIIIGRNIDLPVPASSNMLSIGNLIYATGLAAFGAPSSSVSTGNVGIGTASPTAKLQISLDNFFTDAFRVDDVPADTSPFVINAGGNVGIGIMPSSTYKLDVSGHIRIGAGSCCDSLYFFNPVYVPSLRLWHDVGGAFLGAGPGSLRIDSNLANSGINLKTDIAYDDGVGINYIRGSAVGVPDGMLQIGREYPIGVQPFYELGIISFYTNVNTERMRIDATGNVGIGTASPLYQLQLSTDSAAKPGTNTWTIASDARLKKNIRPLAGALNQMLRLRGVNFEWKEPEKQGNLTGVQMGMIAQDVEQVFPQWVKENKEGYKDLTIGGFEALTVEAMRELKAENEALKKRIEALETRP